jgi:outer membrane protein OmpA-like peptidoglycan-associated protein
MLKTKANSKTLSPLSAALVAVAALPSAAQATISVQHYLPAANSTYTLTEDAMLRSAPKDPTWNGRRLFMSANYNWLNDALIVYNENRTSRIDTLVDGVQTLDLGVGVFMARNFSINAAIPMNLVHLPGQGNRFAVGDTRAFAKWRLTGDDSFVAVSIIPSAWFPTGDSSLFVSDGSFSFGGALALERDFGPIVAAANIGYRHSPNAVFEEINYVHRMPMSLGLFLPIDDNWGLNAEATGAIPLPTNAFNNPGEVYAGGRYQFNRDCTILAGASLGAFNSEAGNDVRLSVGIRFSPMPDPVVIAPAPVFAPAPVIVEKPKPRVVFTRKEIQISEEIKFEHDKAVLTASGRELLDEVADVMKKNRMHYRKVVIAGHTNELGSHPYNQKLSEERAAAVREYLTSRGISSKKMASVGYGKTRPKTGLKGLSKDAKLAANRRVEFKVVN